MKNLKIIVESRDDYGLNWCARIADCELYFGDGKTPVEAMESLQRRITLVGFKSVNSALPCPPYEDKSR